MARDQRDAGGGGFQHHIGQRFRTRGRDQEAPHGKGLPCRHGADKMHHFAESMAFCLGGVLQPVGTITDNSDAQHAPGRAQLGDGVDQGVDALDWAQFADEYDVGRIFAWRHGGKFGWSDAIGDDPHDPARHADLGAEGVARKRALEQEQIGARHQCALDRQIEKTGRFA